MFIAATKKKELRSVGARYYTRSKHGAPRERIPLFFACYKHVARNGARTAAPSQPVAATASISIKKP